MLLKAKVVQAGKGRDIWLTFQSNEIVEELLARTREYAIYDMTSFVDDRTIQVKISEIKAHIDQSRRALVEPFFTRIGDLQAAAQTYEENRKGFLRSVTS